MTINVFAVPVFFVVFREMLETVVIVSVLLAFLKQTLGGPNRDDRTYKKLVKQVWYGTFSGLLIVLIVGAIFIALFYRYGKDKWGSTEYKWEGAFAIVATVIISVVGAALLRVSKMQEKWRVKLANHMENGPLPGYGWEAFKVWCERYAMFAVPLFTILREGLEAIIFIAGVSFSAPASAVPLPVVMGVIAGSFVGYLIYKGGASAKLQFFLIVSTCFLYLIAAGLFSRAIWFLQQDKWNKALGTDAAELGAGAGSYDIGQSVWHVNFGNPELNGGGGWGIFNAILGWQNSATYGSVISYNVYWIVVVIGFLLMRYKENTGHLPLMNTRFVLSMRNAGFPFLKSKNQGPVHPKEELSSVINTSNSSSGIFERASSAQTDPEKAITTVHALPTRTNSE